jgi:hypothetical protein
MKNIIYRDAPLLMNFFAAGIVSKIAQTPIP